MILILKKVRCSRNRILSWMMNHHCCHRHSWIKTYGQFDWAWKTINKFWETQVRKEIMSPLYPFICNLYEWPGFKQPLAAIIMNAIIREYFLTAMNLKQEIVRSSGTTAYPTWIQYYAQNLLLIHYSITIKISYQSIIPVRTLKFDQ